MAVGTTTTHSLATRRRGPGRADRGLTLVELVVTITIAGMALLPLGMVFVSVVEAQQEADQIMEVRRGMDLVDIAVRERLVNAVDIDSHTNDGHSIAFTTTATLSESQIVYSPATQSLAVDGMPLPVTVTAFQVRRESGSRVRVAFTVAKGDVSLTTENVYASVNGQP